MRSTAAVVIAAGLMAATSIVGAARAAPDDVRLTSPPAAPAVAGMPAFSHPMYLPLRGEAVLSCVKTNCRLGNGNPYHGSWAIDFDGEHGVPIYAAGFGVAHIGGLNSGCRTAGGESRGNWVWIDHGAGETTEYHHLARVTVTEGQAVTPATRIGTMGSTGAPYPCRQAYLHFERDVLTSTVKRVEPLPMRTCDAKGVVRVMPYSLGEPNWDVTKFQYAISGGGVGCIGTWPAQVVAPTAPAVRPSVNLEAAILTWTPSTTPQPVQYRISEWIFHPSTNDWEEERIFTTTDQNSFVVPGLTPYRTYRFRVAAWGAQSNSIWTKPVEVILARVPGAPPISWVRSTARSVTGKWTAASRGGNALMGYRAILTEVSTGLVVGQDTTIPTVHDVTFTGLKRHTLYRFAVAAVNHVGQGPYSTAKVRTG